MQITTTSLKQMACIIWLQVVVVAREVHVIQSFWLNLIILDLDKLSPEIVILNLELVKELCKLITTKSKEG